MGLVYSNSKDELCVNLCNDDYVHILSTGNNQIITIYNKDGKLIINSSKNKRKDEKVKIPNKKA